MVAAVVADPAVAEERMAMVEQEAGRTPMRRLVIAFVAKNPSCAWRRDSSRTDSKSWHR